MPGLDAEAALVRAPVDAQHVAHRQRPRADEAHVAAQDVQELRQLVEAELARITPPTRVTRGSLRILKTGPRRLVELLERRLALLGVGHHRAELEEAEAPAAESDALLHEEHRAARVELDDEGEQQADRRRQHQGDGGDGRRRSRASPRAAANPADR